MGKLSKRHLENFLQTTAGENGLEALKSVTAKEIISAANEAGLRAASSVVSKEIISAAKYYMGVPDGLYFQEKDFDESVVKAKKAYVTLNTIMGGDTAERDRFNEGKKQIPEMITSLGIKKMINLFTHLYCFAGYNASISFETVRACRQTEVSEGESIVGPLTSTTKLSVDEIMDLGYGNKNGLAICRYKFHSGAAVFDMEELGKEYLKPEEREVLLLMGNKLVSHCIGFNDRYIGKDGKPALMYDIDVYPPEFKDLSETQRELEKIVYDENTIAEVKAFYYALNEAGNFPDMPDSYKEWKEAFKKLVFFELKKMS